MRRHPYIHSGEEFPVGHTTAEERDEGNGDDYNQKCDGRAGAADDLEPKVWWKRWEACVGGTWKVLGNRIRWNIDHLICVFEPILPTWLYG